MFFIIFFLTHLSSIVIMLKHYLNLKTLLLYSWACKPMISKSVCFIVKKCTKKARSNCDLPVTNLDYSYNFISKRVWGQNQTILIWTLLAPPPPCLLKRSYSVTLFKPFNIEVLVKRKFLGSNEVFYNSLAEVSFVCQCFKVIFGQWVFRLHFASSLRRFLQCID